MELKPCPFCGHTPTSFPSGDGAGLMIECINLGCVGPHCSFYPAGAAVAFWNRRADVAAQAVRVKPLVWSMDGETHSAITPIGEYRVANIHGDWTWLFAWMPRSNEDKIDKGHGGKNSPLSAKAAAEAHHEARILAALDLAPSAK